MRPPGNVLDVHRPSSFLLEQERAESGELVWGAVLFLTNRECPWNCLMCDLWRNTLKEKVPVGAIPEQIDFAFEQLGLPSPDCTSWDAASRLSTQGSSRSLDLTKARAKVGLDPITVKQLKLYNSGSFFDPKAIPVADHHAIADRVSPFERVIVECHPALVNDSCVRFRDLLLEKAARRRLGTAPGPRLEVAMGLETVHPQVLPRLNKRMTLEQFSRAAEFLTKHEIALRVFILLRPPFLDEVESLYWAERSLEFAFRCGASVASLIPTRNGNGALEFLAAHGDFAPPKLATLEAALAYGIALNKGRVFADLWDLERLSDCERCFKRRARRLHEMNLRQVDRPLISCQSCGTLRERGF